jgi:hypothetical protein
MGSRCDSAVKGWNEKIMKLKDPGFAPQPEQPLKNHLEHNFSRTQSQQGNLNVR